MRWAGGARRRHRGNEKCVQTIVGKPDTTWETSPYVSTVIEQVLLHLTWT